MSVHWYRCVAPVLTMILEPFFILLHFFALLVISHDRYFLDEVVDKIWELKMVKLRSTGGIILIMFVKRKKSIKVRYQSLSVLSGGEIMKLLLAKMLMGRYNILLMDEPSNFLDLQGLEAMERMMKEYAGTIVFITHDKRLLENVADKIYEIKDKKLNLI